MSCVTIFQNFSCNYENEELRRNNLKVSPLLVDRLTQTEWSATHSLPGGGGV